MRIAARAVSCFVLAVLSVGGSHGLAAVKQDATKSDDARLKPAYRFERGGWVYVHLEGSPADIGYQHGYLLAPEIEDGFKAVQLNDVHRTKRDWNFYRATAQNILWPHIEAEYRQELQGIADGLKARGSSLDVWDVVALNAMEEVPDYYVPTLNRQQKAGQCARPEGSGQLQRLRRHRLMDEGSQAGDRAQQLDRHCRRQRTGRSSSTSCPRTAITC